MRRKTDDLPLGLNQKVPKFEDLSDFTLENMKKLGIASKKAHKKLIASHENRSDYLISLQMLQLYVELGIVVTAIKRVFKFKQEAYFRDFIYKNIELRKQRRVWKIIV